MVFLPLLLIFSFAIAANVLYLPVDYLFLNLVGENETFEDSINETVEDLNEDLNEDLKEDLNDDLNEDLNEDLNDGTKFSLHSAARHGYLDIVKVLIESGANVEVKEENYDCTPLHYAASNEHLEITKLLVEKKADVNSMNKSNETPLHYTTFHSHLEITKLLIENGAKVNLKDKKKLDSTSLCYFAACI